MEGKIVHLVMKMWLTISVADVDGDKYNHLLVPPGYPRDKYAISYTDSKPLMYRYGEPFEAVVWMECAKFKTTQYEDEKYFSYKYLPNIQICTADKLEVVK